MKRACPDCNGPLVLLTSLNVKVCGDCHRHWNWALDAHQKPLYGDPRQLKRADSKPEVSDDDNAQIS